ncbi:MAG TPA: Wzz/FepE/Etk N-terminal domain-containing protein [Mycobacteriales bacterium]|nr:Wzz/FepE/Etk N-terminal domain-containing protein [Mycobacteriales bacterium]
MDDQNSASLELADYAAMFRRRWWVIALGLLLGLVLAAGYLSLAGKSYTSTAAVLVTPTGAEQQNTSVANGRTDGEINLDTEAQLVTSTVVSDLARSTLKTSTSATDLAAKVTVSVPANTSVLHISFVGSSADDAERGAAAFAQAYLKHRGDVGQSDLNEQIKLLQQKIAQLNASLVTVSGQVASLSPDTAEGTYARSQQTLLQSRITDLNSQLGPLTARRITPGSVISPASTPTGASSPRSLLVWVSGAAAGLVLGLLAAALIDRVDDRIRRPEDLERLGGARVLARLPGNGRSGAADPARNRQSFRRVRQRIVEADDPAVVAVVGPAAGTVAQYLVEEYTAAGTSAALVVAGHDGMGAAQVEGHLSAVLADHPHAVIGGAADPATCAAVADAALAVVQLGHTRFRRLLDGLQEIHAAGTPVVGIVVLPRTQHGRAPIVPPVRSHPAPAGDQSAVDTLASARPAQHTNGVPTTSYRTDQRPR